MENVSFLREPFDALMGNPDAIGGMASSWENIGKELKAVAQEYGRSVEGTTSWEGRSGDTYRTLGADTTKTIDALGEACNGMKAAVDGAGVVVGAVRGIVRDLIAGAIGEIVAAVAKWGIAAACTAGIAAGGRHRRRGPYRGDVGEQDFRMDGEARRRPQEPVEGPGQVRLGWAVPQNQGGRLLRRSGQRTKRERRERAAAKGVEPTEHR